MKKMLVIALFLAVAVSISAQIFEVKLKHMEFPDGSTVEATGSWTVKDGAWITNGKDHVILESEFVKAESDEGNVYFWVNGIDWEGDICTIGLITYPPGHDKAGSAMIIKWSDDHFVWYHGEFKPLK